MWIYKFIKCFFTFKISDRKILVEFVCERASYMYVLDASIPPSLYCNDANELNANFHFPCYGTKRTWLWKNSSRYSETWKKVLKKLNPSWRYKDLNFVDVLKIVTKWQKIWTYKLYISKTDLAFSIFFAYLHVILMSSLRRFSCTFCAVTGKWKFAFSTVTSFSHQKLLKN